MKYWLRRFIAAVSFLTIIPIKQEVSPKELAKSMLFFPLVGLVQGAILASFVYIFYGQIPSRILALFIFGLYFFLCGAIHADGLCDMMDGLGVRQKGKEEILKVMKDSRIGTIGVLSIIFLILLKIELFNIILKNQGLKAIGIIILVPVCSKWIQVLMASLSFYARSQGKGAIFINHLSFTDTILAGTLSLGLCTSILWIQGMILFLGVFLLGLVGVRYWKKKLGGITGDILGGWAELSEPFCLLLFIWVNKLKFY
jgi:adenosylcobinamide-GDP ribazoletransferase